MAHWVRRHRPSAPPTPSVTLFLSCSALSRPSRRPVSTPPSTPAHYGQAWPNQRQTAKPWRARIGRGQRYLGGRRLGGRITAAVSASQPAASRCQLPVRPAPASDAGGQLGSRLHFTPAASASSAHGQGRKRASIRRPAMACASQDHLHWHARWAAVSACAASHLTGPLARREVGRQSHRQRGCARAWAISRVRRRPPPSPRRWAASWRCQRAHPVRSSRPSERWGLLQAAPGTGDAPAPAIAGSVGGVMGPQELVHGGAGGGPARRPWASVACSRSRSAETDERL